MNLNRRQFVQGAGAAAASVAAMGAVAAPALADEVMTADKAAETKWSFEIAPDPIPEDQITQTIEHDFVVVGAGMAGVCCAVAAAEEGCDVIVVTASSRAISRGGSNHAVGSKYQIEKGIEYNPEIARKIVKAEQTAGTYFMDKKKWARWINHSAESIDWTTALMEGKGLKCSLEPGFPDPALSTALAAVAATAERPWGPRETDDAALLLLGAALAGAEPPAPLLRRLSRAPLSDLPPASAALALSALDAFGADTAAAWDRLAERPVPPPPPPPPARPPLASVAAAALARQARAHRRGASEDEPPADVLAHVRWLAARLGLGYRASGAAPDPAHPLDPESALLVALLASSLPRRALADPASGLLPYDWRNHLADRLLALQLDDPPGTYRWAAPDGDDRRATVLAILVLRLLAME